VGVIYDWWRAGITALTVSIAVTIVPIVVSFLGISRLNPQERWFDTADYLGPQKERVEDHFSRMVGTLMYWKSKAAAHYRLHLARVVWSLASAVSLPVLIQRYEPDNAWSVIFMTMLTTWTGFVVALAYTLKSEEKYQGFRQQESDFYDVSRRLLDSARGKTDEDLRTQVDQYIREVNEVRKVGRRVETGSPPSAL
jgi:hypothetical protein